MRYLYLLTAFSLQIFLLNAQTAKFQKSTTLYTEDLVDHWEFNLYSLEAPYPGNNSYRNFLMEQKLSKFNYQNTHNSGFKSSPRSNHSNELPMNDIGFIGNPFNGIPNDNDLAISNDGLIASVCNSTIYTYDEAGNLIHNTSLNAISNQLSLPNQSYDPKIIYDQNEDRFILLFLNGSSSSSTHLVLCFSQTNNPADGWHVYRLEGNPLNNNSWSDFPMIAITEKDFFVTINLINSDSTSWQTGFMQSLIWQVQKSEGYDGDSIITKVHSEIKHNNRYLRNLLPVRGGIHLSKDTIYFISNRNFDLENDTFFIVNINQSLQANPQVSFQTRAIRSNQKYGLPPDAKQPTGRFLQTNDARALSGIIENGLIHFTGNTVDFETNKAAIYHAQYYLNSNQVQLTILTDSVLEYGYPNLSHSGQNKFDNQVIISFNHTSVDSFPGVSAIFFSENNGYSERLHLKSGDSHVSVITGNFQRWGDYTGSQRKFNEPGTVWMSGFIGEFSRFGIQRNRHITYIAKLVSPDSTNLYNSITAIPETNFSKLYPNPVQFERILFQFEMKKDELIQVYITNIQGQMVNDKMEKLAKKGLNELGFNTQHLSSGNYFLVVKNEQNQVLFSNQFVKN
jgi:hypothetical protein